jgi:hypothetical protein
MQGFWITFTDGSEGYCEGNTAHDAMKIAEHFTKKTVKVLNGNQWDPDIPRLPYPARPVIWQFEHPVHGKCPPFCYSPKSCKGNTSCPKDYACSE